jgi:hypothetical protein
VQGSSSRSILVIILLVLCWEQVAYAPASGVPLLQNKIRIFVSFSGREEMPPLENEQERRVCSGRFC